MIFSKLVRHVPKSALLFSLTSFFTIPTLASVDFNHPHMVGFYLNSSAIEKVQQNLENISEYNGYSLSHFYLPEIVDGTGVKKIEEFISDEKTLRSLKRMRYTFRKYFNGFYIKNRHNIQYNIQGIDFTAHWKKFKFDIEEYDFEDNNAIQFTAKAVANRIKLTLDSAMIEDLEHDFIGTIGANKIEVAMDSESVPLELEFQTSIRLMDNGGLKFNVTNVQTNLEDIILKAGWNSPLKLPKVKIVVNGRPAYLSNKQLEKSLKKEIPRLLESMKESANEFVSSEGIEKLENSMNEKLGKGFAEIINVPAINAPEPGINEIDYEANHPNYLMGIKLSELNFAGDSLHIGIDGFIKDPMFQNLGVINPEEFKKSKGNHSRFRPDKKDIFNNNEDLAISINKGFINDMLRKSYRRGYFRSIPVDDDVALSLVSAPFVFEYYNNSTGKYELRLKVNTRYTVSGVSSAFVYNPIELSFDIVLGLDGDENGILSLVIERIDQNSVNLPERFIRMWASKVRSSAKETLQDQNKAVKGYVLSENLPLPDNIFGIPLKYNFYNIDKKGNLILYIDMDL